MIGLATTTNGLSTQLRASVGLEAEPLSPAKKGDGIVGAV